MVFVMKMIPMRSSGQKTTFRKMPKGVFRGMDTSSDEVTLSKFFPFRVDPFQKGIYAGFSLCLNNMRRPLFGSDVS